MFLSDMTPIEFVALLPAVQRINGKEYLHSVAMQDIGRCVVELKPGIAEYQLDRNWHTLHVWGGLSNASKTGVEIQLSISDSDSGASLWSATFKPNSVKEMTLNVSNVARIKLREDYVGGVDNDCAPGVAVWGDAELRK